VATTVEEAQVLFSASGIGKVETAASKANSAMGRLTAMAGKAAGAVRRMGAAATSMRGIVGIAAMGLAAKNAAEAAGEQMAAERKLESVLNATGNAAGFTADELKRMAADLQQVTNYGDEATISAMGVLASFTNIKGDVFKDATTAAQDLSAVMGQDLQSSVVQIGKALNDPIKGVTALQRVGVAFTQQQKDQIAAMVDAGDTMGAQQLILAELKKEFGGAAEAMADPMVQFGNAAGDVNEELGMLVREIGEALLPAGYKLLEWASNTIGSFEGIGKTVGDFATSAGNAFTSVKDQFENVGIAAGVVFASIGDNWRDIFADIQSIAAAAFEWIGDNAGTMAENVGIAVQNSIAEITRAGQQLGEWAAYQAGLSDEMLEIPAAQQKQFKEFTGFAAPTTTALNSMADEITSQIAQREAERQAARLAQEMPKAGSGVMPPSAALAAAGVATVGEDSADILGQAAESLKVIAAQRGSALQAFQRVQDSLTKKTQEIALQQLAEQQKQTGIAEQQLAATKAPQMMVLQ